MKIIEKFFFIGILSSTSLVAMHSSVSDFENIFTRENDTNEIKVCRSNMKDGLLHSFTNQTGYDLYDHATVVPNNFTVVLTPSSWLSANGYNKMNAKNPFWKKYFDPLNNELEPLQKEVVQKKIIDEWIVMDWKEENIHPLSFTLFKEEEAESSSWSHKKDLLTLSLSNREILNGTRIFFELPVLSNGNITLENENGVEYYIKVEEILCHKWYEECNMSDISPALRVLWNEGNSFRYLKRGLKDTIGVLRKGSNRYGREQIVLYSGLANGESRTLSEWQARQAGAQSLIKKIGVAIGITAVGASLGEIIKAIGHAVLESKVHQT